MSDGYPCSFGKWVMGEAPLEPKLFIYLATCTKADELGLSKDIGHELGIAALDILHRAVNQNRPEPEAPRG